MKTLLELAKMHALSSDSAIEQLLFSTSSPLCIELQQMIMLLTNA